jgi:hypothetical protein
MLTVGELYRSVLQKLAKPDAKDAISKLYLGVVDINNAIGGRK